MRFGIKVFENKRLVLEVLDKKNKAKAERHA